MTCCRVTPRACVTKVRACVRECVHAFSGSFTAWVSGGKNEKDTHYYVIRLKNSLDTTLQPLTLGLGTAATLWGTTGR